MPYVIEGALTVVRPQVGNGICILPFDDQIPKARDAELELRNVFAVELSKANNLGNVPNDFRPRPRAKKLVFRLSWPIALGGDVIPYELESLGEDLKLFLRLNERRYAMHMRN